jgi:hypothetical protein
MTFYNILWIAIFSLGGISLGLFGFFDLHYFSILLINPSMFNNVIRKTEEIYQSASFVSLPDNVIPAVYNNRNR